jgi:hypothetical protein
MDLNKYIKEVKAQLVCNAPPDYQKRYVTFQFTNEQVDKNLDYFKDCMNRKLSPYKALELFYYTF